MEAVRDERERKDRTFSPASKLDTLSDHQKEEVESQSRPNAALIHETIRAEGVSELERTAAALLLSWLAAGLSIGQCPWRRGVGRRAQLRSASARDRKIDVSP